MELLAELVRSKTIMIVEKIRRLNCHATEKRFARQLFKKIKIYNKDGKTRHRDAAREKKIKKE